MQTFKLPDLGEGLQEAEIIEWLVKEGDTVHVDQLMVLVETAKAVVEIPSPVDAEITKICASEGDIIHVNEVLVEYEGESTETAEKSVSVVGELITSTEMNQGEEFIIGSDRGKRADRKIKTNQHGSTVEFAAPPSIIAFAKKLGIEQELNKSEFGCITHKDLIRIFEKKYKTAAANHNECSSNQINSENKLIKLSGAKKVMAQTMSKSWQQVPAVTLFDDANISAWHEEEDITLRLLNALIAACTAMPLLNAWFDEENLTVQMFKDINIGVAVNTDEGLYVPVIRKTQNLSVNEVKSTLSTLIQQVKAKKISPQNMLGATISLSNFGTLSGRYATPIVVPPQVAIIGVGKIRQEAVVVDDKIEVGRILPISLTFDHRAASGADASAFLEEFIANIQRVSILNKH